MLILAFVHPVAPGHDDLNSSRYQSVICVWMSYLQEEEGGGKHENARGCGIRSSETHPAEVVRLTRRVIMVRSI